MPLLKAHQHLIKEHLSAGVIYTQWSFRPPPPESLSFVLSLNFTPKHPSRRALCSALYGDALFGLLLLSSDRTFGPDGPSNEPERTKQRFR